MGDMREIYDAMKAHKKEKRAANLKEADTTGFVKHSDYHYSVTLKGSRLDWWPSTKRFRWQGKYHHGDVHGFIRNRTK